MGSFDGAEVSELIGARAGLCPDTFSKTLICDYTETTVYLSLGTQMDQNYIVTGKG